jgi:hypothetical protein
MVNAYFGPACDLAIKIGSRKKLFAPGAPFAAEFDVEFTAKAAYFGVVIGQNDNPERDHPKSQNGQKTQNTANN